MKNKVAMANAQITTAFNQTLGRRCSSHQTKTPPKHTWNKPLFSWSLFKQTCYHKHMSDFESPLVYILG